MIINAGGVNNTTINPNAGNDPNVSLANLSPNSRIAGQFPTAHQKPPQQQQQHRMVVGMPTGNQQFQLPMSRGVSVQIPRQQGGQHRIVQSPFSPQSQTPQSPHDQFPLSPATSSHDQFSRPASECSQDPYLNVSVVLVLEIAIFYSNANKTILNPLFICIVAANSTLFWTSEPNSKR